MHFFLCTFCSVKEFALTLDPNTSLIFICVVSLHPSLVNVQVQHPPEATVQIHQVARVKTDQTVPGSDQNSVEPVHSVQQRSQPANGNGYLRESTRVNSNSIGQGDWLTKHYLSHNGIVGRCFQETLDGQCGKPLPGLTKQEDCCGSVGTSWGFHKCTQCPPKPVYPVIENGQLACPLGYKRMNQTHCQDINECLLKGICKNAECLNTRGSYRCTCKPGYMLDMDRSHCISDKVVSVEPGLCYRSVGGRSCSLPLIQHITKQICCCSRVGKGWGKNCERCPLPGTDAFKETCPAGHGYQYSRSNIQIHMRRAEEEELAQDSQEQRFAGGHTEGPYIPRLSEATLPPVTMAEHTTEHHFTARKPAAATPQPTSSFQERESHDDGLLHFDPVFADVNECEASSTCRGGRCINMPGSYRCECATGYILSRRGQCEDIDECRSPNACPTGRCINTPGSYECGSCGPGYMARNGRCTDINECETFNVCPNGVCVNNDGSFSCMSCRPGYRFLPSRQKCEDIDECTSPGACPTGICTNTEGSYSCLQCDSGYKLSPDRLSCEDIDECEDPSLSCDGGECFNILGSYRCTCPPGFELNATLCQDINECEAMDICGPNGKCLNTQGSFFCMCAPGYSNSIDGVQCQDVDECSDMSICSGRQCINTDGSYMCNCEEGFRRSSESEDCEDIDECAEYSGTVCGSWICENTVGSYQCIGRCQPGFQSNPLGECVDVDECTNETICGSHGFCDNTIGSFHCLCDQGFKNPPGRPGCIDVNECELMVPVCGTALCENVEGSFLCLCADEDAEFDPELGHCLRRSLPEDTIGPTMPRIPSSGSQERKECYYNLNDDNLCENVLAHNTTKVECCCTEGAGWGDNCEIHPCPIFGTAEFNEVCPGGKGYISTGTVSFGFGHSDYRDADECTMFGSEICKDGQCINRVPGYTCYCPSGYYYDTVRLQCMDHDECQFEGTCENGVCVNTAGSFTCFCSPPLLLDVTGKQCINASSILTEEDDIHMHTCWQGITGINVCTRPLIGRRTTYTECCCLYGEAWGSQCAFCPPRTSDDFAQLCNLPRTSDLRERPGYEYGPEGTQFEPEEPPFGPYDQEFGGPLYNYLGPEYGIPDSIAELSEQDRNLGFRGPFHTPQYQPREPPQRFASSHSAPYEGFEGLRAEECGILNGCENGRCVRVREGYTCDCFDGFELDLTKMACIDINECEDISDRVALCKNGQCENTEGSYRCVCLPGYVASSEPDQCVPMNPETREAEAQ
nr:PREDICTED: latent-transforming growth factor beta-binding protein 2 [Latimeria chalumnae]|eukprot:XP_014341338.1 PREDICTED: latent-transforming growth factor beta-binding protein 2 [Latimeria chalumnae]